MKTLNVDLTNLIFDEFALTTEEMLCIRGGDGDPILNPTDPPIKI
jgi:hypothetical protein